MKYDGNGNPRLRLLLVNILLLLLHSAHNVSSFTTTSTAKTRSFVPTYCAGTRTSSSSVSLQMNRRKGGFDYDDDDDDEDGYEYARVRRGRGGRGRFANDDYDDDEYDYDPKKSRRYDYVEEEDYDDEYYDDEYDDDDDDDDEFEDIIPNALLDNIDPDGAVDRLPELLSDGQFWKDSALWLTLAFIWVLGRFDNPMLNGVVDLDKVDFTQFYDKAAM